MFRAVNLLFDKYHIIFLFSIVERATGDGGWTIFFFSPQDQIENADGHFYERALFLKNLIWEHFPGQRSTSSIPLHGNMFESITCPLSRETYYFRNCWFRFTPVSWLNELKSKKREWNYFFSSTIYIKINTVVFSIILQRYSSRNRFYKGDKYRGFIYQSNRREFYSLFFSLHLTRI